MSRSTLLIAMSGGVDSSVAAYLMQQSGYDCIGAMMRLYDSRMFDEECSGSTCCDLDAAEDARSVANRLGMPFYVFNFSGAFREKVMDSFVHSYESGDTPNPCIQCNRYLKFDLFLKRALELGCSHVVTGHYARIRQDENTGRYLLYKAADLTKDQSYFLSCLTQEQLSHTIFPLGEMEKTAVRRIAQDQGFINARKRDSQDICFVPDGDYMAFLERYTRKHYPDGDFLDLSGKVVGKHRGAVAYTLGQRKGLGLAMGEPVYVCGKNMEKNTVTVGPNDALMQKNLMAKDWVWYPFQALTEPIHIKAKARSRMLEQPATAYPMDNGFVRVEFDKPQRAITPGQAVVLYDGDMVVGGGTITE